MDQARENALTEQQRYWLNHVRACEASGMRITINSEPDAWTVPVFTITRVGVQFQQNTHLQAA